jgi:subfamily B ATP-binding cassette protein MsbA
MGRWYTTAVEALSTAPTSTPAESPGFSTRSAFAFYASLARRYARSLVLIAIFLVLYAGLAAARIGSIGLVLDAVNIYYRAERSDAASSQTETESATVSGDGSSVATLDRVWRWFAPSSPSPSERLRTDEGFEAFLYGLVIVLGSVSCLLGAFLYIRERMATWLIARMSVDTRKALFDHLTHQSVSWFHDRRSGDITSRVTNDVEIVQNGIHHLFQTVIQEPAMIVAGILVAYWASPVLLAVALPLLALMVIPIFRAGQRVIKHGRRRQQNLGIITEALQQLFSGVRIVKSFGMERYEQEEFAKKNEAFGLSFRKTIQAKIKARSLQEVLYSLAITGLLVLGAWMITTDQISAGRFSTFILAMVQIYSPLKALSKAWNQMQESHPGVERVLEVLRSTPTLSDRPDAREFPGVRDSIHFRGVGFSYRKVPGSLSPNGTDSMSDAPVLSGIDLEVHRGQIIALVGPSGAGKSTLVDLLARFYDVQEGAILVDGVDIRAYRHRSYLRAIAIVSQDPFLFNTTIRDNIRYGKEDATDDEITAAAVAASAHDFIRAQPEGYDTEIGERGAKLSGGQRQRITIARALLKNAPILILDEATSALDSESEREVQRAIDNLMRDRTTFIIAHRLSTTRNADLIVVLEEGRIVERGSHNALMALRGRYFELYTTQTSTSTANAAHATTTLEHGGGRTVHEVSGAEIAANDS